MKKLISLILISFVLITTSCGNTQKSTSATPESSVSTPQIEMPDLKGLTYSEAVTKLHDKGFTNITSDFNDFSNWGKDRLQIVGQNESSGRMLSPDQEIQLKCKKICHFILDISSDYNLLFSKYDISIYLGDEEVGTVANGKNISQTYDILEGEYVLKVKRFNESSPVNKTKLTIDTDSLFKCSLSHDSDEIEFHDVVTEDLTSKMPDIVGKKLAYGKSDLKNANLYNIDITPTIDSSSENDWIIVLQSIPVSAEIGLNHQITLECKSLNDYYNDLFINKPLKDALDTAESKKLTPLFFNYEDDSDISSTIKNLSDLKMNDWTVMRAEIGSNQETISLYLKNTLTPEEKAAQEKAAAEKAEQEKKAAEKIAQIKADAEKAASEKADTNEAASEKTDAEKAASEETEDMNQQEESATSISESTTPVQEDAVSKAEVQMPIISGTNLGSATSVAYSYGLSEAYEDTDYNDGTIQKALTHKDIKYDLDLLYSASSKELVLAEIITYNFASKQEQIDFILKMIPVLCPPSDVDTITNWFNGNQGSDVQTEINGIDYHVYLSTGGSLIFDINMTHWEDWYLSQD